LSKYVRRGLSWLRENVSRSTPHGESASEAAKAHKPFQDVLKEMAEARELNKPPTTTIRPRIPFTNVLAAYFADPACKAAAHELAFSAVGKGFYHTVDPDYAEAKNVEDVIDEFNEKANLDSLLVVTAVEIAAFGNHIWLIGDADKKTLSDIERPIKPIPLPAVNSIKYSYISDKIKVINKPESYNLLSWWGGAKLNPERLVHFRWNPIGASAFGYGITHSLLEEASFSGEKRLCYLEMKWRIEQRMIDIHEKYAGPDQMWWIPKAKPEHITKLERLIKSRPKEGARYVWSGEKGGDIYTVSLDPRARFDYYVDHIMNQNYLGLETPLAKALTTPGFTEASIRGAIELHEPVIFTMQRFIKREVERLWNLVIEEAGYDPAKAHCRLNWGMREEPEIELDDIIRLAEISATSSIQYIRADEVRKILVKLGFPLTEPEKQPETVEERSSRREP
jgi:hypothetical protein